MTISLSYHLIKLHHRSGDLETSKSASDFDINLNHRIGGLESLILDDR